MSAEDFQVFIDDAPRASSPTPSTRSWTAARTRRPPSRVFLDETMAKIEEALKDGGLKIEGALKEIEATFKKMQK